MSAYSSSRDVREVVDYKIRTKGAISNLNHLQRKGPNDFKEKYDTVKPRVQTGPTADKVIYRTTREISRRREETFARITSAQLNRLLSQTRYLSSDSRGSSASMNSASRSSQNSSTYSDDSLQRTLTQLLLYDVRETETYLSGHITDAHSYPLSMMHRDQTHPQLYSHKNKPECVIVVYCDDEVLSREAAKLLVVRKVGNTYLLSGGMRGFEGKYPEFIQGRNRVISKEEEEYRTDSRRTAGVMYPKPFVYQGGGLTNSRISSLRGHYHFMA